MSPAMADACVFDAYGTLLDLRSAVAPHAAALGGHAEPLLTLWRRKQLEYTWLRTLMGRHADFETVTRDALRYALEATGCSAELEAGMLDAFRRLTAYPDAAPTLAALRRGGVRTAVLSNGDPGMLRDGFDASGLAGLLDHVISVQPLRLYKPATKVYGLAAETLGISENRIVFVSGNAWDAAGAASAGLRAVLIDAAGTPPERLPAGPWATVRALADLPTTIGLA